MEYRQKVTLRRSQWAPVFIPRADTIRAFKKVAGETWAEIDRVDLADSSSADSYSYDDKIRVLLFHPTMVGNMVSIEYEHDGVPNPGTLDTLPTILAEQAIRDYNKVNTGLFVLREYIDGLYTGWNGMNLTISGGMVTLSGDIYSVGCSTWDLAMMGGQSGEDIVTVAMFYLDKAALSDVQEKSRFIEAPKRMLTSRYKFEEGRGLSSALTELNQTIEAMGDIPGFVELLKVVVQSQPAPEPPILSFFYEPRFRVYHMV